MTDSKFYSSKRKVMLMATVVAFAVMVSAAPRAYAQGNGICCSDLTEQVFKCQETACKGQITVYVCNHNLGDGHHYLNREETCCSEEIESYEAPNGYCVITGARASTEAEASPDLYATGVWVRNCAGRYVFKVRPS